MAEVLVEFDTLIAGPHGSRWVPRACGRVAADGLWEGWIEFTPIGEESEPVRTARETEQPNRDDLMYWSQGLTHVYLEAALRRALEPLRRQPRTVVAATPHFDAPAPRVRETSASSPRAVLNPFEVYLQGEDVLLRELSALETPRLRDIAVSYGFASAGDAAGRNRDELIANIVRAVRNPGAPGDTGKDASSREPA